MADMSLAAQMGIGAVLGFVTIAVFSFIAPPPDAMQAATASREADKKIEQEKNEKDRLKLIELVRKQQQDRKKKPGHDDDKQGEDGEDEDADEESRALREEDERDALERQKRMKAAGVDMEKIRKLVGELESEGAGTSKLTQIFLQILRLLFLFVVLIMVKLSLNNIGVNFSDLFPRELALLQGNVRGTT